MRDKLLSAHALCWGSALCLIRRASRGRTGATTILTRRPGHCGRPAPELRSIAQLPKVFIGGFREHGLRSQSPPIKLLGALMEQAMRQRTKFGRHSSGLSWFKTEI